MDQFQYELHKKEVNTLTTKKSKLAKFRELIPLNVTTDNYFYRFKILTYLLYKFPGIISITSYDNTKLKKMLLMSTTDPKCNIISLLEFSGSTYNMPEFVFKRFSESRYTPYQLLEHYMFQKEKSKNETNKK